MRTIEERRIDPQSLYLRTVLLSRPVDKETREQLAAGLFAAVRCNFGLGEILDPGLCVECEVGLFHVHEDQFLAEVCDGELVITTLAREAMPLLRYRTRVAAELCPPPRLRPHRGPPPAPASTAATGSASRFYEAQVAEVLAQTRAAGRRFHLEASDRQLRVAIEISEALFANTVNSIENPKREFEQELLSRLGLEAEVRFIEPRRPR